MEVTRKTVYNFNDCTYLTISDVQEHIEDLLGFIIDKLPGDFGAGERLKVYDWLIANKDSLVPLLSITYDRSDDVLHSDIINILDY